MAVLGPLKRIFWAGRPSYKRVSSTGSNRRLSNPPQPDVDDDYDGDDDIVHGAFVYCAFLMLGLAMLLPWFSFTTAAAFFRDVFSSKPALAKSSTSAIAATSTIPNLLVMFVLARERTEKNINKRIITGLSMNLSVFILFSILIFAVPRPSPTPYFIFTLFSVLLGSSATALIQYASFGLAGRFGPLYTQALMTGQGLSGIFPPIASIVSETSASNTNIAAGIFFACSAGLTGATLVVFLYLKRITPKESAVRIPADASVEMLNERTTIDKPLDMLKRMGIFPWAVGGVFLVTLAVFPSLTSSIVSTHTGNDTWFVNLFIPLHFLLQNTADFIGRAIPGLSPRYLTVHNPKILGTLVCLRILFWPLFWSCNVSNRGPWLPIFGDLIFFIILGLFGLSNGWVATCLMMEGGMYVPAHEREKANSLMSFCLCIGYLFCYDQDNSSLALGSFLSFVVSTPFIRAD